MVHTKRLNLIMKSFYTNELRKVCSALDTLMCHMLENEKNKFYSFTNVPSYWLLLLSIDSFADGFIHLLSV